MSDHIARARDYIAKGDEFYSKAADEIAAWLGEDFSRSHKQAAEQLGRSESWVSALVRGRTSHQRAEDKFQPDWQSGSNRRDEVASRVLANPEQRKQVIASLPAEQIEEVIATAQDVAVERVRAQRAEHDVAQKAPTAGELMGGDRWDPSESWADTLLIRCNRNLRELGAHVQKWGFVLGSMPIEDAYQYIEQTERIAAEVRAAVQEQLRDRAGV